MARRDDSEQGRAAPGLRVGSWPGRVGADNRFLPILLDALEARGCVISDMPRIDRVDVDAVDLLLLHWPEAVFWEADGRLGAMRNMARLLARLGRRRRRAKVLWIAHNLAPHRTGAMVRLIWPRFMRRLARVIDGAVALSPGTAPRIAQALDGWAQRPVGVVWHPLYPHETLSPADRSAARAARGWDETTRVIGYCGQLRAYKGLDALVAAFRGAPAADLRLLIAGRPAEPALTARLEAAAAADPRIALAARALPAPAFREALAVCDVVAAPFVDYLHSGSLVHALSAGAAVLTPETPFSRSLQSVTGPDWVRLYEGPLGAQSLERCHARPAGAPDLAALSPDRTAADLLAFAASIGAPCSTAI